MKFIIVGCGSIGQRHLRNLVSLGIRDFVFCDTNAKRLKIIGEEFNINNLYTDYKEAVSENEDLDVLADIIPFCKTVVNRLNLMTVTNTVDLLHAATGYALPKEDLQDIVRNILRMESILQNTGGYWSDKSSLPQMREGQISEISRREEQTHESIVYRTTS